MTHRCRFLFMIATILCASGCEGDLEEDGPETLRFEIGREDAGTEGFYCFDFDRPEFTGRILRGIRVESPEDPALKLHHAVLYAVRDLSKWDAETCMGASEAGTPLHVWTPGAGAFELPPDVGLHVPPDIVRFAVDVHTLRLADGPLQDAKVILDFYDTPPPQIAARMQIWVTPPVIEPHATTSITHTCTVAQPVHAIGVWGHMHKAGKEFLGELIRPTGERETIVHVDPWNFNEQLMHPISLDIAAGDKIDTRCVWENTTPNPIKFGPLSTNEMCDQTILAWPAEAARCD